VAWILVVLGKAKDYKDNDGNEESDFISWGQNYSMQISTCES
jgi:hypothetical protein